MNINPITCINVTFSDLIIHVYFCSYWLSNLTYIIWFSQLAQLTLARWLVLLFLLSVLWLTLALWRFG